MAAPEDIVAQINGNFGRWQLRTILLIFLCKVPSAWFMACVIYTAPTPRKGEYYCQPTVQLNNISSDFVGAPGWVRLTPPVADGRRTDRQFRVDACNIYEERLEHDFAVRHAAYVNPFEEPHREAIGVAVKVIPCQHFEHNAAYESLVTQFDLVCSRQLLVSMTQSFHALGALVGGLVAVLALKHVSPRRLMLIGMLCQIFFGNLTGLVGSFQLHVYFRCLTSLFCALMYTSGQIILSDITGGKAKIIVTTLFELFWSIGLILLPGISIFFDSWSYLYVAISSSVVVLVFLHRWIADSPRWLLRHGKIERSLRLLLESAAFNDRNLPLNLEAQLNAYAMELQAAAGKPPSPYWTIWDGRTARKFLFAIHWAWAGAAVLYNVMLLMIRSLGVDHIHVNTACMGFAEMVGVFLGLYLILYTRRRWMWAGNVVIVAGLCTFFVWLVPHTINENRRVGLELIFWLFLKMANSATLSVLTTCSGELVALEKRPLLMLSVTTFSRIVLVVAPFISTLTIFHKLIPITVFAALALINGMVMSFLLDRSFWNREQPRIQKVLSPNTYRRNSAILLLRRSSTCSELNGATGASSTSAQLGGHDNQLTISISDLWQMNYGRFDVIEEQDHDSSLHFDGGAEKVQRTTSFSDTVL